MCPRKCGADRKKENGACGVGDDLIVSKLMLHHGEEPVISGTRGSGAVFFGGCSLGCVYCQNADISVRARGEIMSAERLEKEIYALRDAGAHNIELVTAGHYLHKIIPVLERIRPQLGVPVIYNTSAYERVNAIKALDGLVDVYLPDLKYVTPQLAEKYSMARDYPDTAIAAIEEAVRQQPKCTIKGGLIERGVVVRHLVLPGNREEGIKAMRVIAKRFKGALVSVMRQYTPEFNRSAFSELSRRVTSFEYESVLAEAERLGLDGFFQQKGCETNAETPDFNKIY